MSMDRRYVGAGLLAVLLALAGCHDPSDFNGNADDVLQAHVAKSVLLYDAALGGDCYNRKVVKATAITTSPSGHAIAERWSVDQCGKVVDYRVNYTPDGLGSYNYDIHQASTSPVT